MKTTNTKVFCVGADSSAGMIRARMIRPMANTEESEWEKEIRQWESEWQKGHATEHDLSVLHWSENPELKKVS